MVRCMLHASVCVCRCAHDNHQQQTVPPIYMPCPSPGRGDLATLASSRAFTVRTVAWRRVLWRDRQAGIFPRGSYIYIPVANAQHKLPAARTASDGAATGPPTHAGASMCRGHTRTSWCHSNQRLPGLPGGTQRGREQQQQQLQLRGGVRLHPHPANPQSNNNNGLPACLRSPP